MEMTGKQEIEIARALGFSKYNKVCRSLADRPDETGLTRVPKLKKALSARLPERAKVIQRADPCRLSCWLSEAHRAEFNRLKSHLGISGDKALVVWLIEFAKENVK